MTKLTNFAVLTAALSLISTTCMTPSAFAQNAEPSSATSSTQKAAAPSKAKTAKKRVAKKRAKLKSDASKIIKKGVEQAGTNLDK